MEEDYEIVEWEEGRIDSIWDWAEADIVQTLGIKGANNAGLTLCRRRSRLKGSPLESQLFVCKALNGTRHQGMRSVKRELDMLRACVHPNILGYEDFSYNGKTLDGMNASLYTEHCAYGDLDQFRFAGNKSQQKLSFQEGAQVFRQLAQALLYIHHGISITDGVSALAAKGQTKSFSGSREQDRDWQTILHRDIKPSNG
jgi:serine/threonine protein kinase